MEHIVVIVHSLPLGFLFYVLFSLCCILNAISCLFLWFTFVQATLKHKPLFVCCCVLLDKSVLPKYWFVLFVLYYLYALLTIFCYHLSHFLTPF